MGKTSQLLTRGEVHRLLEIHHLKPSSFSVLACLGAVPPAGDAEALKNRELLGPEWRNALLSLCRPSQAIRVVRPAPEMSAVQLFYRGAPDRGLFTGCWPEENGLRLSHSWTPAGIAAQIQEALWVEAPGYGVPFEARLSPSGLAVWAAAMDSLRALLFVSLLRRTTEIDPVLTLNELEEQLHMGWAFEDARWVVTLIRALLPAAVVSRLSAADLEAGARELEAVGLLQGNGRHAWKATKMLRFQVAGLKNPLPALAVAATFYNHVDAKVFEQELAIIRGDGPLWLLSVDGSDESDSAVILRSPSGHDLMTQITGMITREVP
jgi:hypothetical protein